MEVLKPAWISHDGPIYSVDVQPGNLRFATGGAAELCTVRSSFADCKVKIWCTAAVLSGELEEDAALRRPLFSGSTHQGGVRVVRWSPSGTFLASGGEDGAVVLWLMHSSTAPLHRDGAAAGWDGSPEVWRPLVTLKTHVLEVLDLCFSPCETYLATASCDSRLCVFFVPDASAASSGGPAAAQDGAPSTSMRHRSAQPLIDIVEHEGAVEGVAWDPFGRFLATFGEDKHVLVWTAPPDPSIACPRAYDRHGVASWSPSCVKLDDAEYSLMLDAADPKHTAASFRTVADILDPFEDGYRAGNARRCDWSPDGSGLSAGHAFAEDTPTCSVLHRGNFVQATHAAGHTKPVGVVRHCPAILAAPDRAGSVAVVAADAKSRKEASATYCALAVGSVDNSVSVWLPESCRSTPACVLTDVFDAPVSDLAWGFRSCNGVGGTADGDAVAGAPPFLLCSSMDGAVCAVLFAPRSLGVCAPAAAVARHLCHFYGVPVDALEDAPVHEQLRSVRARTCLFRGSAAGPSRAPTATPRVTLPSVHTTPSTLVKDGSPELLSCVSAFDILLYLHHNVSLYGPCPSLGVDARSTPPPIPATLVSALQPRPLRSTDSTTAEVDDQQALQGPNAAITQQVLQQQKVTSAGGRRRIVPVSLESLHPPSPAVVHAEQANLTVNPPVAAVSAMEIVPQASAASGANLFGSDSALAFVMANFRAADLPPAPLHALPAASRAPVTMLGSLSGAVLEAEAKARRTALHPALDSIGQKVVSGHGNGTLPYSWLTSKERATLAAQAFPSRLQQWVNEHRRARSASPVRDQRAHHSRRRSDSSSSVASAMSLGSLDRDLRRNERANRKRARHALVSLISQIASRSGSDAWAKLTLGSDATPFGFPLAPDQAATTAAATPAVESPPAFVSIALRTSASASVYATQQQMVTVDARVEDVGPDSSAGIVFACNTSESTILRRLNDMPIPRSGPWSLDTGTFRVAVLCHALTHAGEAPGYDAVLVGFVSGFISLVDAHTGQELLRRVLVGPGRVVAVAAAGVRGHTHTHARAETRGALLIAAVTSQGHVRVWKLHAATGQQTLAGPLEAVGTASLTDVLAGLSHTPADVRIARVLLRDGAVTLTLVSAKPSVESAPIVVEYDCVAAAWRLP